MQIELGPLQVLWEIWAPPWQVRKAQPMPHHVRQQIRSCSVSLLALMQLSE